MMANGMSPKQNATTTATITKMCNYTYHHYPGCGHMASLTFDACMRIINAVREASMTPCQDIPSRHDLLTLDHSEVCMKCESESSNSSSLSRTASKLYIPLEGMVGPARVVVSSLTMDHNEYQSGGSSEVDSKEHDIQSPSPVPLSVIQNMADFEAEVDRQVANEFIGCRPLAHDGPALGPIVRKRPCSPTQSVTSFDDYTDCDTEFYTELDSTVYFSDPEPETPCPVHQVPDLPRPSSPTESVITNPYEDEDSEALYPILKKSEPWTPDYCRVIHDRTPPQKMSPVKESSSNDALRAHDQHHYASLFQLFDTKALPTPPQSTEPVSSFYMTLPASLNSSVSPNYGNPSSKGMVWDEAGSLITPFPSQKLPSFFSPLPRHRSPFLPQSSEAERDTILRCPSYRSPIIYEDSDSFSRQYWGDREPSMWQTSQIFSAVPKSVRVV
ncbi:hypothetical protein BO71DRAFT_88945 [Aspergillus ellipticus CBS 707.79]|uniref:Uncharacterized protein n=1 Tax=Aspergillus ellipticus CBS 707.79 TaxID=1448320 RepID=A0A319DV30_9EURO|nr:hypothetical protein BO71DRAFT_88945 [Aspergillus ellipticus CBS 707.79]